jgi:predicted nucleic acid-binding protein
MLIVVDASAILAVLLNETSRPAIIEATTGMEAISPSSLPWEVGNALSANVKRKRLTTEQAIQAVQAYHKISIRLIDVDIEQAIRISNELNLYAYDAYILLCAYVFKAPLLCLDKQMVKLAKGMGIKTVEV